MAKHKKVTQQPETTPEPIIAEEPAVAPIANDQPAFIPTDTENDTYRQLLLEHPNRPFITNMSEATRYFEDMDRWWSKVKQALK